MPAGTWFGETVDGPDGWALAGCTMAPGFHFDDFELADRRQLLAEFPDHTDAIERLTRDPEEGLHDT